MIHQQNTHWYKPEDGQGWTANPFYAKVGEIEKRGYHDCNSQNCKEKHGGSAEEFITNQIRATQTTRKTKGD